MFSADKINGAVIDAKDRDTGISIDDTQVNVGYKYESPANIVIYTLTIQRSTGRFAESFRFEKEKMPFAESTGYCMSH